MLFLLLWFHIVGLAALDGFPTRQVEVEKLSQIDYPAVADDEVVPASIRRIFESFSSFSI